MEISLTVFLLFPVYYHKRYKCQIQGADDIFDFDRHENNFFVL